MVLAEDNLFVMGGSMYGERRIVKRRKRALDTE